MASLEPREILQRLVRQAHAILGSARCSVIRLDPENHPEKAFVFTSAEDPSIEGYALSLHDYPEIVAAMGARRPILVRDDPEDEIASRIRALHRRLPFPLSFLLPLVDGPHTYGVLILRFAKADPGIHSAEIELCALAADAAAQSMTLARALDALSARVAEQRHEMERVEEVHRLRMELLSSASHDLRTPLHSMLGYVDLLLEGAYGDLTGEQAEKLDTVAANGQTLLQIVSSLVDHARLAEGGQPLETAPGEIQPLLDELRVTAEPLARPRGTEIYFECVGAMPKLVTDWGKLKRILLNLIHNALKFSPGGRVTVTASSDAETVSFEVADTGPGISQEELSLIFDRFYRVNPAHEDSPGGLGLSIVKRYTEVLGGRVSVASETGNGSRFRISIPRRAAHEATHG